MKIVGKKNQYEVLEIFRTMGDVLPTSLADILEHPNVNETDDDELHLNDDTGWENDNYDKGINCYVDSDNKFDG